MTAGRDRKGHGRRPVGAPIVHRTLPHLFCERGVKLWRTYQLNRGGSTDTDASRITEEFISRNGRGSAEPSERPAAAAQH